MARGYGKLNGYTKIFLNTHYLQPQMELLTEIQKEKFLSISGFKFISTELRGSFTTPFPYNDREWKFSPWIFSYIIDNSGNLICELEHRMTNNRIYGWDKLGNDLPENFLNKYFQPHF